MFVKGMISEVQGVGIQTELTVMETPQSHLTHAPVPLHACCVDIFD